MYIESTTLELAKKRGLHVYNTITQSELQRYLREQYRINIEVKLSEWNGSYNGLYSYDCFYLYEELVPFKVIPGRRICHSGGGYETYEAALEEALCAGLNIKIAWS